MEKKFKEVSFWTHNTLSAFRVMHNITLKKAVKEAKASHVDYILVRDNWYDIPVKISRNGELLDLDL